MTRSHDRGRHVAIVVAALAFIAAPGCSGPRLQTGTSPATATRVSNDLTLEASVEQSFVLGPDPLVVSYALRNHGQPRNVRSHPFWFELVVVSPAGRRVQLLWGAAGDFEPPLNVLGAELLLPTDSVLRGIVDLRCVRRASAEYPHEPYGKQCIFGYEISKSGEYRIMVRYKGLGYAVPAIESDTIRLRYLRNATAYRELE